MQKKSRVVREFLTGTSMHGLKYVAEKNRHTSERIFWIVMFVTGVAFSGYLSWAVWSKYEASPILINVESTEQPVSQFDFPAVTVCPQNKISKSKMELILQNPKYKNNNELAMALSILADVDYGFNQTDDLPSYSSAHIGAEQLINLTLRASVSCSDILIECSWLNVPTRCDEIFYTKPSDNGLCCTFNTYPYNWDTFQNEARAYMPKRIKAPGYRMGLTVALDAKLHDVYRMSGKSNGFKVLVHEGKDFPEVGDRGFLVTPGTGVNVGVEPIWSHNTEAVNRLPMSKRQCIMDPHENFLEFYQEYSPYSCYAECLTKQIIANCSCRPYFHPGNETKLCLIEDYPCVIKTYEYIRSHRDDTCKQCFPVCDDLWFNLELSYAEFPSAQFNQARLSRQLKDRLGLPTEELFFNYLRNNMALLNVYYRQPSGVVYSVDLRFGIEDLISAIGGLLGLGFGFSFISAVEILCFSGFHWISRKAAESRKTNKSNKGIARK